MSRSLVTYWEPTAEWLRERNPKTKKEILTWYERGKRRLDARRHNEIGVKFTAYEVTVDRSTGKEKRSKEPRTFTVQLWKLSADDHYRYKQMLDERFSELKEAFNQSLKKKKHAAHNRSRS